MVNEDEVLERREVFRPASADSILVNAAGNVVPVVPEGLIPPGKEPVVYTGETGLGMKEAFRKPDSDR